MTSLLTEVSQISAPGILTVTARECWEPYVDDPATLDWDAIVRRDPNPTSFVIDRDRAWMVDFGCAVRGPAWMTAAAPITSMRKPDSRQKTPTTRSRPC